MKTVQVKTKKAAATQIRLHVIKAVHAAIVAGSVEQSDVTVPTFVPAGLGSTQRLRATVQAPESAAVEAFQRAQFAAVLTGDETHKRRAEQWGKRVSDIGRWTGEEPSKPRKTGTLRPARYVVRVPAITALTETGEALSMQGGRVILDMTDVMDAYRSVAHVNAQPVAERKGTLERGTRQEQSVWSAWQVLAEETLKSAHWGQETLAQM
jgi:hypothetical protein